MEEENKDVASSIFETVSQLLSENSETLEAVSNNTESKQLSTPPPVEWSMGRAPVRTAENDPNFKLIPEEDTTSLIDTRDTPENIQSAVSMLLGVPEFKDFIGQYALSNDIAKNIETIQQAISQQKNFEETPERVGEVDGKYFTGGEAYFLQELLNKVQDAEGQGNFNGSEEANTFFDQLRSDINTEVLQKIEKKENIESETADNNQPKEEDAWLKTKKLFNEREGELVEDLTREEAFAEYRRINSSPEMHRFQTEEIGYDANIGHPDLEIREYETKMNEWRKQLPHPEIDKPEPPENFEERRNKPKKDYDSYKKEGLSHEDAVSAIYTQHNQQQIVPAAQPEIESKVQQTSITPQPEIESKVHQQTSITPQPEIESKAQQITPVPQPGIESKIQQVPQAALPEIESNTLKIEPTLTEVPYKDTLQQEQTTFETTSELPTNDIFAQAEETKDGTSEEILANTQKTNTTLEGLTQVLSMLVQALGKQMQQPPSTPVAIPAPPQTSSSQPGMSDAMLATGAGMISTIRGKFIYPTV